MDEEHVDVVFEHDVESEIFEGKVGKQKAVMTYRSNREGKIFLTQTEVDEALKETDVADQLIAHVFAHIRQNGMRLIPKCPVVTAYLKKHPENMDIVASGIQLQ